MDLQTLLRSPETEGYNKIVKIYGNPLKRLYLVSEFADEVKINANMDHVYFRGSKFGKLVISKDIVIKNMDLKGTRVGDFYGTPEIKKYKINQGSDLHVNLRKILTSYEERIDKIWKNTLKREAEII